MNILDKMIAAFAPQTGLKRVRARSAISALMNYDAATTTRRSSSWRPTGADADAAAARRARLSFVARDMVRNTPLAIRGQTVIANNVVGDGIIPKVNGGNKGQADDLRRMIGDHLDTTSIDADGRCNLYGLQRLVVMALVVDGEVLVRYRNRERKDNLPLMLQLQVIEADYIDTAKWGTLEGGGWIREGIEFDAIGRRVAYWLFKDHPGAAARTFRKGHTSHRVPASEVLHIYRQDRPGQMRGVSWFAPVSLPLQDAADHQDAQLMRQKIAACFAAFRTYDGDEPDGGATEIGSSITPGTIRQLKPGEDIVFANPPTVDGGEEFTRSVYRSTAVGLGITYEALTGDLSNVNFTSYKAGRIDMDQNITSWQWLLIIPQLMQPIGRKIVEQWALERGLKPSKNLKLEWVPPVRPLIDPAREIPAMRDKVRAGFASRQGVIRELGHDPERILEEQTEDAAQADAAALKFDSDARNAVAGSPSNPNAGGSNDPNQDGTQKDGQNAGK